MGKSSPGTRIPSSHVRGSYTLARKREKRDIKLFLKSLIDAFAQTQVVAGQCASIKLRHATIFRQAQEEPEHREKAIIFGSKGSRTGSRTGSKNRTCEADKVLTVCPV